MGSGAAEKSFSHPACHCGKGRRLFRWHQGQHLQTPPRSRSSSQGHPFFDLSCDGDHGRIDIRRAAVRPVNPVDVGLLSAHSAVRIKREWVEKIRLDQEHVHIRHFISSLSPERPAHLGKVAREHWSIENRNHHKRDDSVWQEDRHRRKTGLWSMGTDFLRRVRWQAAETGACENHRGMKHSDRPKFMGITASTDTDDS